ncbi:hypothetical protein ACFWN4_41110, partial [Streptomyces sp. NPDC058412]
APAMTVRREGRRAQAGAGALSVAAAAGPGVGPGVGPSAGSGVGEESMIMGQLSMPALGTDAEIGPGGK